MFQIMYLRQGPPSHKAQSRDKKPISVHAFLKGIVLKSGFVLLFLLYYKFIIIIL